MLYKKSYVVSFIALCGLVTIATANPDPFDLCAEPSYGNPVPIERSVAPLDVAAYSPWRTLLQSYCITLACQSLKLYRWITGTHTPTTE